MGQLENLNYANKHLFLEYVRVHVDSLESQELQQIRGMPCDRKNIAPGNRWIIVSISLEPQPLLPSLLKFSYFFDKSPQVNQYLQETTDRYS